MHPDIWEKEMSDLLAASLDDHFVDVVVGDQQLTCLSALSVCNRQVGLLDKSELPKDGMIFICPTDSAAPFSRADMPFKIGIWFYDKAGKQINGTWNGDIDEQTNGTWPGDLAIADSPYRYVIESRPDATLNGDLVSIRLTA